MNIPKPFDIFIDISACALNISGVVEHLRRMSESGLFGGDRRITVAVPPDMPQLSGEKLAGALTFHSPVISLQAAIAHASSHRRALVVVLGVWSPTSECLCALAELLAEADPMIATLQPRFANIEETHVLGLAGGPRFPKLALASLPKAYITPEHLCALFVLTTRAVQAAPALAAATTAEAYTALLTGLRRRGFRNSICNHVAVPFPLSREQAYPTMASPEGDAQRDDVAQAQQWFARSPAFALEAVLSSAFSDAGRPKLLLDGRGLPAHAGGMASCCVGLLEGFAQLAHRSFDISVLATAAGAEYHDLRSRFADFDIQLEKPRGTFLAAIRLSQPDSIDIVRDLHAVAGVIMFNILDTTAWDVIHSAPDGLDRAWRVSGQVADALFFSSNHSLQHFGARFAPASSLPLIVARASLSAADMRSDDAPASPDQDQFLLVVGGDNDHAGTVPTLCSLVDAFPFMKIVALGMLSFRSPKVECVPSGQVPEQRIHALYAQAAAVVFPAHDAGCALPVAQGLAYGKTVIVRDAPLWAEIAALSRTPELIVPFVDEIGLVEAVGTALHRRPDPGDGRGAVDAGPREPSWSDCADTMLQTAERLALEFDGRHWLARQALLVG